MRHNKAFTFLELMVTVSMIVTVLTLSSVAYRNSAKRIEIIYTAQSLAGSGRLMQAYAASSKAWKDVAGNNIWGLYIDKNNSSEYKLWVDTNTNETYETDELYKTIQFPKQITISKIVCTIGTDEPVEIDSASISFTPPNPLVKITRNNNTTTEVPVANNFCDTLHITLKDSFNQSEKVVSLNFFGLIDVER